MAAMSQEDLLIYRRAETANREVLDLLEQVIAPSTPVHDEALAASRRLDRLLSDLLRGPVEADPTPPQAP
jgi:hypothetical protein